MLSDRVGTISVENGKEMIGIQATMIIIYFQINFHGDHNKIRVW
jgi:hypothetical protein